MRGLCVRLATGALALSFGIAGAAGAATVQVKAGNTTPDTGGCGAGSNPCDTIQAGVENASTGDVVNVAKGDYAENVRVGIAGIRIRGAGSLLGAPYESCPGALTRTVAGSCAAHLSQPACEAGWDVDRTGEIPRFASCAWNGAACALCDTIAETDGTCANACTPLPPVALSIEADDVTVEKLRVRAAPFAGIGVAEGAERATIRGVRVDGPLDECVAIGGDAATVSGAALRFCGRDAILVGANDVVLEKNRLTTVADAGIFVRGGGAVLARNSVTGASGPCARVDGDGMLVDRNRLSLCSGVGLDLRGSALRVSRNTLRGLDEGLDVTCRAIPQTCADVAREVVPACSAVGTQPDCDVAAQETGGNGVISCFWNGACSACNLNQEEMGNCVDACLPTPGDRCDASLLDGNKVSETHDGECFVLDAPDEGLRAERNTATGCADDGFQIDGIAIEVIGNTVADCRGDGFEIDGVDHFVADGSARGCAGDGFRVEGSAVNVTLVDDDAIDNGGDGFDVLEFALGTRIDGALATNNTAGGVEVSLGAVNTAVEGSRASGNLPDFCDEGSGTTSTGNQFGTTGTPCTPD
jgi:hypothetical protein